MRAINQTHIFVDGNKRTSILIVKDFLSKNNYSFELKTEELESFAIYVATKHPTLEEIALWIENHSKSKDISEKTVQGT